MTNETKNNFNNHTQLTLEALKNLQTRGYKYLQVQGFTLDHHPEYIEPHYIILVPIRNLSNNPAKMDIYEDIDSATIREWVATQQNNESLEIFLAPAN